MSGDNQTQNHIGDGDLNPPPNVHDQEIPTEVSKDAFSSTGINKEPNLPNQNMDAAVSHTVADAAAASGSNAAVNHNTSAAGSHFAGSDTDAADHDICAVSHDQRTATSDADTFQQDTGATESETVKVNPSEHLVNCEHDTSVAVSVEDVEDDVEDGSRHMEMEAEDAQLLPGDRRKQDGLTKEEDLEEEDSEIEVMADVAAEDMNGRLENLTQSILDLQGRAEAGVDLEPAPYVRRRGLGKYSNAMKSFLPVRGKSPKDILPLSSLGCLNLSTYGWVTPIVLKVYRKGVESLNSYKLSDMDTAESSAERLERLWNEEVTKRGPDKASLRRVIFRAFRTRFICTFIAIFLFVCFSLLNPIFIIRSFLEYLSAGHLEIGTGLCYVLGMMACELLRSLSMSVSWYISYQSGMRIRAGAMTLLFKKLLHLKGLKDKTVGELVNLVGNDSQRIFEALAVGPLVLSGPVAMIAGCIYAVWYLGPWALVGCAVFAGFYPFNTFVSRLTTYLRRKGIFVTDKRVRMMNELLTCIKLIKMYAWEKPFAKKIADIRLEERRILEKSAMVQSISTSTAVMVPAMAAALTFIAIVTAGNDLTAAQAFSFMALLNSMRFVLGVLPYGVKALSEMSVAVNRYTNVLLMQEMEPVKGSRLPENVAVEVKDATLAWSYIGNVTPKMPESKKKKAGKNMANGKKSGKPEKDEEKQKMLKDEAKNPLMLENNEDQATLRNITLSLEKGKLLGVCGSVGSGKSSLIHAILGRMETVSGTIAVGGSVAYVPQQAWIMNTTARENILFGAPFDEEKYNKVVEACALQTDFDTLVSGDTTEIGERGINLSGGQKQRISLARALYSDSDIYLLDDPLSAVDIHIGRHIFTNCITGVLAGKSTIFVTHQLQYLPQCDNILFLKDRQISESGHHDDMMAQNGEYATLMRIYYNELDTSGVKEEEDSELAAVELSSSPRRAGLERGVSCISTGTENTEDKHRVLIERALSVTSKISKVEDMDAKKDGAGPAQNGKKPGQLIAPEEAKKGSVDRGVILDYMKASGGYFVSFLIFIIFFLTVATQNSAGIFLTYWLGQGSDNTTIIVNNRTVISRSVTDHPELSTFTLIYGMTVVLMVVFLIVKAITFMKYTLKGSSTMHDDVFGKVLRCPMTFFDTTPLGRIVNRFSSDMDEVDVRLPMTSETFFSNIIYVLFSLGMIIYVAPWFALALVPLVVVFVIMFLVFTRTIRDMKRLDMVSKAPLISHLTASVQGITTIYAYDKTKTFLKKYCALLNTNSVPFIMFFIANRWLALRLDLISACITSITGLIIVLTYEHITPAMAGLALSSALQMTGLFQFTVRLAIETEARFTSVQRLLDYSKTEEAEAAGIIPDKRPSEGWPKQGKIVFNKVQMRYRDNLPLTLKGVTFKINAQEKIGIVGRTGSGKSTLGVVLFRLVELSGGSIKIDDLDISTIGLEDLRSKLSIIPQDPVLFVGTVRYNLDPFNHHTDDQLWIALEKCHIKDSIAALEQKLEAPVVENGENFSVGERQLLCMARALLRHSKILMLDEATAAIDTETDALVQATLKEAFSDCTMLIIAHRLNTVLSCDKILVMDDGKVAEFDRPSVLMSRSESAFRTMLEATEGSGLD